MKLLPPGQLTTAPSPRGPQIKTGVSAPKRRRGDQLATEEIGQQKHRRHLPDTRPALVLQPLQNRQHPALHTPPQIQRRGASVDVHTKRTSCRTCLSDAEAEYTNRHGTSPTGRPLLCTRRRRRRPAPRPLHHLGARPATRQANNHPTLMLILASCDPPAPSPVETSQERSDIRNMKRISPIYAPCIPCQYLTAGTSTV